MPQIIKIILVSDNHGDLDSINYIKETYQDADYFIHCGDACVPPYLMDGFAIVQGNNDPYNSYPNFKVLEIGKHRIYVSHGHHDIFFGDLSSLKSKAELHNCDIVCYGHSHITNDVTIDGIRFLNPGSIRSNRDGSKPSYMIITLKDDEVDVTQCYYEKA